MANVTVRTLRSVATSPLKKVRLNQLLSTFDVPPYDQWADDLEVAIASGCIKLAQRRNYLKPGEDNLTNVLLMFLDGLGFDARMEVVNGNSDISVRLDDYLWIGEAKIGTNVSWLLKGYAQLTDRYATGQRYQDRGGLVVYCVQESVAETMTAWRAALAVDRNSHTQTPWNGSDEAFHSVGESPATGRPFRVLHVAAAMLHQPNDATVTISKGASAAAKTAKQSVIPESRRR